MVDHSGYCMSDYLMGIALQSLMKLSGETNAISSSKQAQIPSYRDKYHNAGDQQIICQMFHLSLPLPGCSSCLPGNFDQLLGLARRIAVEIYLCWSAARD